MYQNKIILVALFAGTVVACSSDSPSIDAAPGRWYAAEQVSQGKALFVEHCASCHGKNAESTTEWRKIDANGNYPPPPLNGSAHAWHHPMAILEQTIATGGMPVGGVMPGFASTLSESEIRATIAYFQNFWPDEAYARWQEINNR